MSIAYKDLHPEYQGLSDDLGPPCAQQPMCAEDVDSMADRLPPRLVEFMAYSGKATYLDGAVTLCNPREMAPILALVFKADQVLNHKDCTVVSYGAFGTLRLWSKRHNLFEVKLAEGRIL